MLRYKLYEVLNVNGETEEYFVADYHAYTSAYEYVKLAVGNAGLTPSQGMMLKYRRALKKWTIPLSQNHWFEIRDSQ